MKPATALPWHLGIKQAEQIVYNEKGWAIANATVYHGHTEREETKANAAYIVHASNAYPRLVAMLGTVIRTADQRNEKVKHARALLRELGEE